MLLLPPVDFWCNICSLRPFSHPFTASDVPYCKEADATNLPVKSRSSPRRQPDKVVVDNEMDEMLVGSPPSSPLSSPHRKPIQVVDQHLRNHLSDTREFPMAQRSSPHRRPLQVGTNGSAASLLMPKLAAVDDPIDDMLR